MIITEALLHFLGSTPKSPFKRLNHSCRHVLGGERDLELDRFGGTVKAFEMFFELEYDAIVSADSFEYAVAVEHAMVKNGD
jgi:hypothetical protein